MKLLFSCLCACVALSASGQTFGALKINISPGYARPNASGVRGNFLLSLEPKYAILDHVDLGFRAEIASMTKAFNVNAINVESQVTGAGSLLATLTYMPSKKMVRPYTGLGVGVFSIPSTRFGVDVITPAEKRVGMMGRIGFKTGHFTMGVEYNIIPPTKVGLQNNQATIQNSYFSIKTGVDIGGGKQR